MSLIIFGASGFLGRALWNYFSSRSRTVLGTYCANRQPGLIQFDLRHPDLGVFGAQLKGVRFAIIACAAAAMDRCRTDWDRTYGINVSGTTALISQLQGAGITPVFISTDYVYEGTKGNYAADDQRVPILAYGAQKKAVEDFLLGREQPFLIVRPGRIYSLRDQDNTIVTAMANDLRAGKILRLATDQVFSLSYIQDACQALDALMEGRHLGSFNACSEPPISRFELARLVKARLNITTGEVMPCLLRDLEFGDNRPLDTSMSSTRFVEATGLRFETVEQSLGRIAT